MRKTLLTFAICLAVSGAINATAATFHPLKYGDFDNWVTRTIHESGVIGGHTKTLYEVGPTATIDGNKAYTPTGGSPWANSNVYAKVAGISKGSNAVFPADHPGHGKCAKLCSMIESVKVLGMINMDVMVAGSVFLGQMREPITSTKNPYAKINMGVPMTQRPTALRFDYKVDMPAANTRVKSSGFGAKKTLPGRDHAVVFVLLQRRWEDAEGNLHAARVATGGERFTHTTPWVNGHDLDLAYGDISGKAGFDKELMGLRNGSRAYYARNSKGEMKPVEEEAWDSADAKPTHVIVMFSSGSGEAYIGTPGLTFYVDNVGWMI